MLDIRTAIRLVLKADATVYGLVGDRINPRVLSQTTTFPALMIRLQNEESIEEAIIDGDGIPQGTLFIFSTARGDGAADVATAVDSAVRAALLAFRRGSVNDGQSPLSRIHIQKISRGFTQDFFDDQTQTHQVVTSFEFWTDPT